MQRKTPKSRLTTMTFTPPLATTMTTTMTVISNLLRQRVDEPRRRLSTGIQIGIGTALFVLLLAGLDLFPYLRLSLNNVYFVPRDTTATIVIVAADDASHAAYGRALTDWTRDLHAELVSIVSANGARVLAFDVLFADPDDADAELLAVMEQARLESDARTRFVMPAVPAQREDITAQDAVRYSHMLLPTEGLRGDVVAYGHTSALPDVDGVIRWQPTRIITPHEDYFSFAIVSYLSYNGVSPMFYPQVISTSPDTLHLPGELDIPVDATGQMRLNYFTAPGTDRGFTIVSYQDVINGDVDPAVFNDKIVLVGVHNYTGFGDRYGVPISLEGRTMSGVEIHANIIETLLQHETLSWQSVGAQSVMLVLLALFAGVGYGIMAQRWTSFVLALLALLLLGVAGAFVVFTTQHHMVDLFYMLLALGLPAPVTLVVNTILETRRRQRAELLLDSVVTASSQRLELALTLPAIARDLSAILRGASVEIWLWDAVRERLDRAYPAVPPDPDDDTGKAMLGAVRIDDPAHEADETASEAESDAPPLPPVDPAVRAFVATTLQTTEVQQNDKLLGVPLAWQQEPLGVIVATTRRRPSRDQRDLLMLFGWQTASIIANVVQYRETAELSDLKTRLLRMASHDLKNPLSVVMMYAELMQEMAEEEGLNPKTLERLGIIYSAGHMMLTIVEDILDLERVRSSELKPHPFNLRDMLQSAVRNQQPTMDQKKQTFTVELPDEFPILEGDERQLRQAVTNLLSNACKYTPKGGTVTLRLTRYGKRARIEV
ncbi:MAG: CHASE2 domain-containing protein, partial [Anaerolineae bacterium]|nr:CHASE2 domain-containing protein [Anaerolineae bacterium]